MATRRTTRSQTKAAADDVSAHVAPVAPKPKAKRAASKATNSAANGGNATKKPRKEKDGAAVTEAVESKFKTPEVPKTPVKGGKAAPTVALKTPPPVENNFITSTAKLKARAPASARRVDPHSTNALLSTPRGSRLTTYPTELFEETSKLSTGTVTTTENLLEVACAHLINVDPRLKPLVEKYHCEMFSPEGLAEEVDPFVALCSSIMSQQVSGAAASSIKKRFIELFPTNDHGFPTPVEVAATSVEKLRTAGLSQRKAEYIQGLAEKFTSGELSARMLIEASDEEIIEKLTAVRGLGRWSVEMFSCFALKRMDIFSTGDLGVQRGLGAYLGRDVNKLKGKGGKWKYATEEEMLTHSAKFAPYRSLFMWYMWRIEDVKIDALQGT
ncbi:DNA glycosylase [Trichodelitschia bisporula]|uniref:DNA glycosylase n=1 Tax=Trichodelitschia bisporula TaxID=703511 RepID=A0A6G1HSY2_9PEZI|nr:DNA glycosylase [Trichodelitschia bisporula]